MSAKRILVLGGGFAGLWAAAGAARKLDELGLGPDAIDVTLVNRDIYHNIRVRNYEADLTPLNVPLDDVLGPIGVGLVEGMVSDIDFAKQTVAVTTYDGERAVPFDRLVFALGSQLARPDLPGLSEQFFNTVRLNLPGHSDRAFDVDTFFGAARLDMHLKSLARRRPSPGQWTVLVVGAGLTGIETACEMPSRLRALDPSADVRVILADHKPHVGSDMGEHARPVIEEALAALGIETRIGVDVASVDASGVTLGTGERIDAATVVWCAGMKASPLTRLIPATPDRFGRVPVDACMRVVGVPNLFAAGDSAWAMLGDGAPSVMSCQHGRPMGRFAGHNVVCDLVGLPLLALDIDWYVTVLDLGPWGAVYTAGRDRQVVSSGGTAKRIKQDINGVRIVPPPNRDRQAILAAAAPVVQRPPGIPGH